MTDPQRRPRCGRPAFEALGAELDVAGRRALVQATARRIRAAWRCPAENLGLRTHPASSQHMLIAAAAVFAFLIADDLRRADGILRQ